MPLRNAVSKRTEGFTLIELMIVVVIIAVVAALALPSIATGLRDRAANQAALDLVRLARRARAEAAGYGRAHMLHFDAATDGSAELYRGFVGRCALNNWAAVTAGGCDDNTMCIDSLVMNRDHRSLSTINMALSDGTNWLELCFETSGVVRHRTTPGGTFTDANVVNGGFQFLFQRYNADGNLGVARRVLVPLGGTARILR